MFNIYIPNEQAWGKSGKEKLPEMAWETKPERKHPLSRILYMSILWRRVLGWAHDTPYYHSSSSTTTTSTTTIIIIIIVIISIIIMLYCIHWLIPELQNRYESDTAIS